MNRLRQLSPQEVFFIGGETASVYQHTAGLALLDASDRPEFGFETFRRFHEERLGKVPIFRWKLHEVPLALDLPYWVEDNNFSFDHHIHRIAVPSPGDHRVLAELAAHLYAKHLDRSRPLWEFWFIEGLADGQYALLQKMHHCMMDGEAAAKLGEAMSDFEPDPPPLTIDPAIANARAGDVPTRWRLSFNAARRLSSLPSRIGREVSSAAWSRLSPGKLGRGKAREKPRVPITRFNAAISADRGFAFGSLPLQDIKQVKNYFNVTVNDVVLALVSGSMRDYLLRLGELPDESLRAIIAVSLRTDADDPFSNKVTNTNATLATALADPVQRLQAIAEETGRVKQEARSASSRGVLDIAGLFPPAVVKLLNTVITPQQVTALGGANLAVSNVRGSQKPIYIAGARVTATYPMSIISPGAAINFTCVSYVDNIDIGIAIDPDLVPNAWSIVEGLHSTLKGYLALSRPRRRRPKPGVKSARRAQKRTRSKQS